MRFAILQTNSTIGDVKRNFKNLERIIRENSTKADLFITSEQALLGYPARDLLSQNWLLDQEQACLESVRLLSAELKIGILIGHCERRRGAVGKPLYNSVTLYDTGVSQGLVRKRRIPSYDIFEEERFFEPWTEREPQPLTFRGLRLGVSVCEDGWERVLGFGQRDVRAYAKGVFASPRDTDLLINMSASPYAIEKRAAREDLFCALSARANLPLLYANAVGGQDDILFDGASFMTDGSGKIVSQAALFREQALIAELTDARQWSSTSPAIARHPMRELEQALTVGLRDFAVKSRCEKVVLGLSGGIDSALCAAIAARAVGSAKVLGVGLPSKHTSALSKSEAQKIAQRLGIEYREIPIEGSVAQSEKSLGLTHKLALENLQSRTRGLFLTTLANAESRLVISTGNKSELAMGYSTLYGDLCGALCPIGDLYKTEVYALAHHLNAEASAKGEAHVIPEDTLRRAPTAELAPGQKDSDSLPEYEILDGVLKDLIENQGETMFSEEGWNKILAPRFTVRALREKYLMQEFKRRQAPPILKVHQRSFGSGWKMPVAKGFS